jgi:hypothetical protein
MQYPSELLQLRANSAMRFYPTRLALRLVEAYVTARFPVILAVKTLEWWGPKYPFGSHAVVVVGVRESKYDLGAVSWIVHDPGYKPFGERAVVDCLRAALCYSSLDKVHLIAVAEQSIVTNLLSCVEFLDACDAYFRQLNQGISIRQIVSGMRPEPTESDTDIRIRLLRPEDFGCMFPATTARQIINETVDRATARLGPRRYWCIGGYVRAQLRRLWLFEAEVSNSQTDAIVVFLDQGFPEFHQWRRQESWHETSEDQKPSERDVPHPPQPPKPDMRRWARRLLCSVMTSSSSRYLPDLFTELQEMNRPMAFDLLMLRREDLEHLRKEEVLNARTAADALSQTSNIPRISDWIIRHLMRFPGIVVPALATYFPQITSINNDYRRRAVDAIAGCIIIAQRLARAKFMTHPIVEIVCGSQTDRCDCRRCAAERARARGPNEKPPCDMYVSSVSQKITRLIESLHLVCDAVQDAGGDDRFYLAVEIEPGATYVLNSLKSLESFIDLVRVDPILNRHVGINLDIAHLRIAEEDASQIKPSLVSRVLHAHISDHPFMHTRDQLVGKWTSVECGLAGGYRPYLQLLAQRLNATGGAEHDDGLPFSGAVALELEGCNRVSWVWQSLGAMEHLCRTIHI